MTAAFPEDLAPRTAPSRPSYALGLLLNLLLPGAGFTYVGQWVPHVAWFFLLPILAAVTFTLSLQSAAAGAGVVGLTLGLLLFTYHLAYRLQARVAFQPRLGIGVQIAMIAGHLFLGFFYVGMLAAVVIPNVLAARGGATAAADRATAHQIRVVAAAAQIKGTLGRACPLEGVPGAERVSACELNLATPDSPGVSVTFKSGRTVTLP